ncbi:MAG: hypothetical protein H6656_03135 [Ardenticatenaceae bacterium]|nr:hypothetical protein [Anaerolineales bacterium]MCB9006363.1 hypothetical protein [Ardenticatenaceae bacterium]
MPVSKSEDLRLKIQEHFNLIELKILCFDLAINPEYIPHQTLPEMAFGIINYCARDGLLQKLLDKCKQQRPHVIWPQLTSSDIFRSDDGSEKNDIEIIKFFRQCLDRPAFQKPFFRQSSMEAFDKAMEDTVTAINTGCLRSRDGIVLAQTKGKSYIENPKWIEQIDVIVDQIRSIRSRFALAMNQGEIESIPDERENQTYFYIINEGELAEWMDRSRRMVIHLFNNLCEEAKIHKLHEPE